MKRAPNTPPQCQHTKAGHCRKCASHDQFKSPEHAPKQRLQKKRHFPDYKATGGLLLGKANSK